MNALTLFLLTFILVDYLIHTVANLLNTSHISTTVPKLFRPHYSSSKYAKAQKYLKHNTIFSLISSTVSLPITFLFILGGFNQIDLLVNSITPQPYLRATLFVSIFYLINYLISLPFSIYQTFVIEAKFDFNQTTPKTFFFDQLKNLLLTASIGLPVFLLLYYFFSLSIPYIWIIAWLFVAAIQLFLIFIFPTWIMPLFNRFTPLKKGTLKSAILDYAHSQNFPLQEIYTMDGSKRSTKTNAFFTGFGKFKRIVLYDTLIKKHTTPELVAILAHEIGHYKKRHIHQMILLSLATIFFFFFFAQLLIHSPSVYSTFSMQHQPIYAGIIFVAFLFQPLHSFVSLFSLALSRRNEFQADHFAITTYPHPKDFVQALIKLSVHNLSNLHPHRLKILLEYSHPPVLTRISKIQSTSTHP